MKGFSESWIDITTYVKEVNLEEHVEVDSHLHTANLKKKQ